MPLIVVDSLLEVINERKDRHADYVAGLQGVAINRNKVPAIKERPRKEINDIVNQQLDEIRKRHGR